MMSSTTPPTVLSRGLVQTPLGMLHYKKSTGPSSLLADESSGQQQQTTPTPTTILALHMSPRSTDEYTEVMPLLSSSSTNKGGGDSRRRLVVQVVAIDEPGYGCSDNPIKSCSLDDIADAYICVADHLGIREFVAAGSLMGCFLALSLASRYPERVKALVLTNLYYYPHEKHRKAVEQEEQQEQQQQQQGPIADSWELHEDGSHLEALWKQRSSWLDAELNSRAVHDEPTYLLKRRQRYAQGISIQNGAAFDLKAAAAKVTLSCPVLCIMGAHAMSFFDAIGLEMTSQFELAKHLFPTMPHQVILKEPAGTINLINQNSNEWSQAVLSFLGEHGIIEI